jgi:hypothetical protein
MANRCIYFVRDNQLYKRTIDVIWDKDSIDVNKIICEKEMQKIILPFMRPCVDVSSASHEYIARSLATCYVKDKRGTAVRDTWKKLDENPEADILPPGAHDLIYLSNLNEQQVWYALDQNAFYDIFHNPDKQKTCSAKALATLQLLYVQNKLDYIEDANKFLWWYFINCQFPLEWVYKK